MANRKIVVDSTKKVNVNVIGRGLVPGTTLIAPVYNTPMVYDQVRRLLNYKNFRVYSTTSGLITLTSIDKIFAKDEQVSEARVTKLPEKNEVIDTPESTPIVTETPVEEPATLSVESDDDTAETVSETAYTDTGVTEEVVDETVEDAAEESDDVKEESDTDETAEEETTETTNNNQYNNKKKKKRH